MRRSALAISAVLALALAGLCATPTLAFDIEFVVIDGTASYQDIQLKGTMTDWLPVPMDDADGDHAWRLTLDVSPGDHQWGAIENDGSEWGIWLIDGPNLELNVAEDGTVTGQTMYEIPPPGVLVPVTFLVDMSAEEVSAQGVHVAGSFQGWYPDTTELFDPDGDGIYAVTVEIEEDTVHQYKFVNGASWDGAEAVPADCGVDDGFGGSNRELVVPPGGGDDVIAAYVFGACEVPTPVAATSLSQLRARFR